MQNGYDIIIPVFNEKNILKLLDYLFDKAKKYNQVFICYDSEEDITVQLIKKSKFININHLKLLKNPDTGPVKQLKMD